MPARYRWDPATARYVDTTVTMYVEAGRATYHVIDSELHEEMGFDEERSIRYSADSCAGCIGAERLGWALIGTIPPIGTRTCLGNCLCRMEYRRRARPRIRRAA